MFEDRTNLKKNSCLIWKSLFVKTKGKGKGMNMLKWNTYLYVVKFCTFHGIVTSFYKRGYLPRQSDSRKKLSELVVRSDTKRRGSSDEDDTTTVVVIMVMVTVKVMVLVLVSGIRVYASKYALCVRNVCVSFRVAALSRIWMCGRVQRGQSVLRELRLRRAAVTRNRQR